jgi:hypothetical protein
MEGNKMVKKILGCLIVPYIMLGALLYKNSWKKLGVLVAGVPSLIILIIFIAIVSGPEVKEVKTFNYESSKEVTETTKPKPTATTVKPTATEKPKPTTKPTSKPKIESKIESKIEKQIKVLDTSFEGVAKIKHNKKMIKVIPYDKNFMLEVFAASKGNKKELEGWNSLKESIVTISKKLDEGTSISITNNLNEENEVLIVYQGIVLYDVVEG